MSVASLSNRTVQFERATITRDATGGRIQTWADSVRVKCRIQPLSGADVIRHSKEDMSVTHKAYTSGTPDIQPGDKFTLGSRTLFVQAVRDIDMLGRYTTLECEERDDDD